MKEKEVNRSSLIIWFFYIEVITKTKKWNYHRKNPIFKIKKTIEKKNFNRFCSYIV